jgi:hypothetical protein
MTWLKSKYVLICLTDFMLTCFTGIANNSQPSQELLTWQKKYPGNAIISISKELEVTIDLVNNVPQTTFEEYREMIVH